MKILLLAPVFSFLFGASGYCADYRKGADAYNEGNYEVALEEWRPLAERGDARAQFSVGIMHAHGRGVPQSYEEAARWYRLAGEQGNTKAQIELGFMYEFGRGVSRDDREAARWYRLAAGRGNAKAQLNLGSMYAFGKGVPEDYVYAHMWYSISASLGNKMADKRMEQIEKIMSPSQIEKAEELAKECMGKNYKNC